MKLDRNGRFEIPAMLIPGFRTSLAIGDGVEKELLFTTWGGIGDQICAEPTLRYAIEKFKGCKIYLASELPELFAHLKFEKVFDLREEKPDYSKFLVFETMTTPDSLAWQFISHMITNCIDCCSLNAIRAQLPISYKTVLLHPAEPSNPQLHQIIGEAGRHVIIHAGRHWESKTYPKDWWDSVFQEVVKSDLIPVLIGKDTAPTVGVVDMDCPAPGIDLRNRCNLNDTIWLCKNAELVICSDSSPLHMAATGDAHIACVTTAKHPDYITHWRKGGFGWRTKFFQKGGIWDVIDFCPNKENNVNVDKCSEELIRSWLPEPKEMVEWLLSSRNS